MRTQAVIREVHSVMAGWMSTKTVRVLVLLGSLVILAIAVNATIILLDGRY